MKIRIKNRKDRKQRIKEKIRQHYDLSIDNLAIPEIHTQNHAEDKKTEEEQPSVTYDNVAIPEIHIQKRKKK